MNELCVVTTFQREELLWLCLEAIGTQVPVVIFSDRGHETKDLSFTGWTFGASIILRPKHQRYGNSWNLLEALRWATTERDPEIVHLVEDDTLVHPGYFDWAREALRMPPIPAAVCGRIGSSNITNWYESPCASWNANHLRIALSHLVPEYLEATTRVEMQRVMDAKMFPESRYKKGGAEQDGMFLRCIEHHKWTTKFPPKPLATHLGAWGMNRPPTAKRPTGTFQERIAWCRALLKDRERRVKLFGRQITDKEMHCG